MFLTFVQKKILFSMLYVREFTPCGTTDQILSSSVGPEYIIHNIAALNLKYFKEPGTSSRLKNLTLTHTS